MIKLSKAFLLKLVCLLDACLSILDYFKMIFRENGRINRPTLVLIWTRWVNSHRRHALHCITVFKTAITAHLHGWFWWLCHSAGWHQEGYLEYQQSLSRPIWLHELVEGWLDLHWFSEKECESPRQGCHFCLRLAAPVCCLQMPPLTACQRSSTNCDELVRPWPSAPAHDAHAPELTKAAAFPKAWRFLALPSSHKGAPTPDESAFCSSQSEEGDHTV